MAQYISLTAIGKDKQGIVSAITEILYEYKCNIEDSTMTILQGQFAMILILKLPENIVPKKLCTKLTKSLKSLEMSFSYVDLPSYTSKKNINLNPYIISVYGADKIGIVYNISSFLAERKINITDVQTTISKSKGKKTYIMIIEADFPKNIILKQVEQELASLAKSLDIAISVNRAESVDI